MEGDAKVALLRAAIGHLAEHGLGGATLRGIASAIGTSHRMLIYHFGSRDGLEYEAVVRDRLDAVDHDQRRLDPIDRIDDAAQ